jgi:hypothetical protein
VLLVALAGCIGGFFAGDALYFRKEWAPVHTISRFVLTASAFFWAASASIHRLWADGVSREATKLDFTTVLAAEATSPTDEEKIKAEVRNKVDDINGMVRTLKLKGRYDITVDEDIALCKEHALDISTSGDFSWYKLSATCALWSYLFLQSQAMDQDNFEAVFAPHNWMWYSLGFAFPPCFAGLVDLYFSCIHLRERRRRVAQTLNVQFFCSLAAFGFFQIGRRGNHTGLLLFWVIVVSYLASICICLVGLRLPLGWASNSIAKFERLLFR